MPGTVADPAVVTNLTGRLQRLTADRPPLWGSLTAHQMVAHLADVAEAVLGRRPFSAMRPPSRFIKFVALRLPLRWPRGIKSTEDPASKSLPTEGFETDRFRAITTLAELASAPADQLTRLHPMFGPMSRDEWRRWAHLHTDHHLRQFGL